VVPGLLSAAACLLAEHGLWVLRLPLVLHTGSVAVALRLSYSSACGTSLGQDRTHVSCTGR